MSPADAPLSRDRILAAAEDVIRRFGPDKANVVDVARALGVSHAAVYRHVATMEEEYKRRREAAQRKLAGGA